LSAEGVVPFFVTVDPKVGTLGAVPGTYPEIETPTLRTPIADPPVSMVHWSHTRLIFAGDPATQSPGRTASHSMVVRANLGEAKSEPIARNLPILVVAAGLVSCAPGSVVR